MSKITLSPLPSWKLLIASFFYYFSKKPLDASIWIKGNSNKHFWFSRSAYSLLVINKWWKKYTNNTECNIWIPDYFCNEPLTFLRQENPNIYFYPITDDLIPDWDKCYKEASKAKPSIFIMVHYFGRESDAKNGRKFCNENDCILVEDSAHVMTPNNEIGSYGEFTLYSPHKFLSIPDGSILIQNLNTKNIKKLSKKDPQDVLQEVIDELPNRSPSAFIWIIKRSLQKLIPSFFLLKNIKNKNIKNIKYKNIEPFQSKYGRALLRLSILNLNEYENIRKINSAILSKNFNSKSLLFNNNDYTPYLLGIKSEIINNKNIPYMKWPDLPPEVEATSIKKSKAAELKENISFIPIHHTLGIRSIKNINRHIKINNKINTIYSINKFSDDRKKWLINDAKNLTQAWEYGEAKKDTGKWVPNRYVICKNNIEIAFYQTVEKKFGPVKLIRINRGPTFVKKINLDTKYDVFKELKKIGKWWKGRVLIIAPDLSESSQNNSLLIFNNFKKLKYNSWTSSTVDLSKSELDLRMNLSGKWRNQLKKSEKSDIILKNDNSKESLSILLEKYQELMDLQSFQGPSVNFYNNLFNKNKQKFHIFWASRNDEIIGGVLIVSNGNYCTYQIGWNSDAGRFVYANNFLIWNALISMKSKGYLWFDSGGIDSKNQKGIARFKRGVGGKDYSLIGEWIGF